jgi:hypothetical protein
VDRWYSAQDRDLPEAARLGLLLLFGLSTAALITNFGVSGVGRVDLLLFSASLGAILTSLVWLALLALRRSRNWAVALWLGIWIPYLNLLLAAGFARRYWSDGARAPALVAIAGFAVQTLVSVRTLLASPQAPI